MSIYIRFLLHVLVFQLHMESDGGRIILEWILQKQVGRERTGFIWLSTGTWGHFLRTQ